MRYGAEKRKYQCHEYFAKWIREGRLKVNSIWNKDLKIKFTAQDPWQIIRRSLGDAIAEDLRDVIKAVVGEENFTEMHPNRSNNYRCGGGGGGFLQSGFKEQRLEYGKLKDERNCHDQYLVFL